VRADENKPGVVAVVVVYALWACDLVGVPLRYVRKGRGPRCDDLLTKLLAFALMPYLVLFLGGRPTPVANAVWLLLVVFCVGGHLTAGWRQAEGFHSRFIGLSLPELVLGVRRDLALAFAEPALWAAVGLVFRAVDEVGLANYLWLAGATGAVEYLVLTRRDHSLARDVRDARIEREYQQAWFEDRPGDRL
jgi:hypothetical protein